MDKTPNIQIVNVGQIECTGPAGCQREPVTLRFEAKQELTYPKCGLAYHLKANHPSPNVQPVVWPKRTR